jgi:hypothetical protein
LDGTGAGSSIVIFPVANKRITVYLDWAILILIFNLVVNNFMPFKQLNYLILICFLDFIFVFNRIFTAGIHSFTKIWNWRLSLYIFFISQTQILKIW